MRITLASIMGFVGLYVSFRPQEATIVVPFEARTEIRALCAQTDLNAIVPNIGWFGATHIEVKDGMQLWLHESEFLGTADREGFYLYIEYHTRFEWASWSVETGDSGMVGLQ